MQRPQQTAAATEIFLNDFKLHGAVEDDAIQVHARPLPQSEAGN
jgi:hypothetical protein